MQKVRRSKNKKSPLKHKNMQRFVQKRKTLTAAAITFFLLVAFSANLFVPPLANASGAPTVDSVAPDDGALAGGDEVTITGTNFVTDYIQSVTLTNSTGSTVTDWQIKFTLDTATLVSAGKLNADCSDLRVRDSDQRTMLEYWVKIPDTGISNLTCADISNTEIWTKVPSIPNGGKTIYITYGDSTLTSDEDPTNVFILFDDFEAGSIDANKWTVGGNVVWKISSTHSEGAYASENGNIGNSQNSTLVTKSGAGLVNIPSGYVGVIDFDWRVSSESGFDYLYYCKSDSDTTAPSCTSSSGYINRISGSVSYANEVSTGTTLAAGNHRIKFAYEKDGSADGGSDTGYIDVVKVRKYSASVGNNGVNADEAVYKPYVTFGGSECTNVNVVSSTSITCNTPAHAAGAVDVIVQNPDNQSDTLINGYTYNEPPTLTNTNPTTGPNNATLTGVAFNGTDFISGITGKLTKSGESDISCTGVAFVGSTQFTCNLPLTSAAPGDWNVVVTNPDGQTDTLTNAFTITLPPPVITNIDPDNGTPDGGTAVTITGTGFSADAYRRAITLGNTSGSEVTNYEIRFTVDTNALITAGKMNSDCSDLRVRDEDDSSVLPYWIESGCNTASTVVWTQVPSIPNGGKTVYLHYGNSALTNAQNGDNVFIFFDDFEGGSIDTTNKWEIGGDASFLIDNSIFYQGAYGTKNGDINDSQVSYIASKASLSLIEIPTGSVGVIDFHWKVDSGSSDYLFYCHSSGDTSLPSCTRAGGYINQITGTVDWTREISSSSTMSSGFYRIKFAYGKNGSGTTGADTGYVDVVKVRQYNSNVADGTVSGTEVDRHITVTFDGNACTNIEVVSSTTITCTTPAHIAGAVNVVVTNPDTQSDTATNGFTYNAPPDITSVNPTTGVNSATITGVEFNGTSFLSGITGKLTKSGETDIECTGVSFIGATQFTCNLPITGAATGTWNVVVINPDTQSDTLTNGFTITLPAPTVTSASPNNGKLAGGTAITITGTYFVSGATVTVGGSECTTPNVTNATTMTCTTPSHAAGAVNIVVTNPDTQTGTGTNAYTYNPFPTFSAINPNYDFIEGGDGVTITGTGFLSSAGVTIGGSNCTGLTVVNSTTITCTAPAHAAGAVDVVITNTDTQSVTGTGVFTYLVHASAATSTFTSSPGTVTANGTTASILTATVKDADSNVLSDRLVAVATTSGPGTPVFDAINCSTQITLSNSPPHKATTNGSGQSCFKVTSTTAGTNVFTATNETDSHSITQTAQVIFTAGAVDAGNSTVVADPVSVPADNTTTSTITVTLKDANNNAVASRTVQLTSNGTSITYDPSASQVTNASGIATFDVSTSLPQPDVTFTATDITDAPSNIEINTVHVEFTCVIDDNEQCIQIEIEPSAGVLTLSAPDDFSFLPFTAIIGTQNAFSHHVDSTNETNYVLNVNDVVTVTDTRGFGGFTLQIQASTPFQTAGSKFFPLQNFFAATETSSTGGSNHAGIEFGAGTTGVDCTSAPLDVAAAANFVNAGSFSADFGTGYDTYTVQDLMLCGLVGDGRNGTFSQNVNYYLLIPSAQSAGAYSVTLTFDLSAA